LKAMVHRGRHPPHDLLEMLGTFGAGVDARQAVDELACIPSLLPCGGVRELGCQHVEQGPGRPPELLPAIRGSTHMMKHTHDEAHT